MKPLLRGILLGLLAGMASSVAFAQGAHHGHAGHDHGHKHHHAHAHGEGHQHGKHGHGAGHGGGHHHGHSGHGDHNGGEHNHESTHGAAAGGDLPLVEAEVRRVNTRANTLSVRHGDIPNIDMPPMTMTFQVADPALLEGLSVGDNILVTVDRIDGAYTVMSVEPVQ